MQYGSMVPFCPGVIASNGIVVASTNGAGCPTLLQTTVSGTYFVVYSISAGSPTTASCGPYCIQTSDNGIQYGASRVLAGPVMPSIAGNTICTGNAIFSMTGGATFAVYNPTQNQNIIYAEISITQLASA